MFRKILHTFGTRGITAVLNLAIAILLSQVLGAEGKGEQGLIITTIAFILVFCNLIGGATLVYLTPRYRYESLIIPSWIWSVIVGAGAYFILNLFPLIDGKFIIHVSMLAVLNSFLSVNSSLLIGKEKIAQSNLLNLLVPVLTIGYLLIAFLAMGADTIDAYITALYIAYFLAFMLSLLIVTRVFGLPRFPHIKIFINVTADLFRFGFLNQLAHITQMVSFRLSYYILEEFHGEAAVGIYSNAIQLAESIWLISKSISLVQYARIANVNDHDYSAKLTVRLVKFAVLVSAGFLLPLIVVPPAFYGFIFGQEFLEVKHILLTLTVGVLVYNVSILVGHFFSGLGKYHLNAIASAIGMLLSILIYLWLIPRYGMTGAGWGTSISYVLTSSILIIFFRKYKRDIGDMFRISREDIRFFSTELRSLVKREEG